MTVANFPSSLPPIYTTVPGQTLAAAGHMDALHELDRLELRALGTKLGLVSSSPAAGKALMGTASGSQWDTFARKNLLMNGDFRLATRAISGVVTPVPTDGSYSLDGWKLMLEAAVAAVITQDTSDTPSDGGAAACKLTVGSGEDNKFGIMQIIPYQDMKHVRGKTVSLQAKIKATAAITDVRMAVLEWTGTADNGGTAFPDPINNGTASWNAVTTVPTLTTSWAYLGAAAANLSPTTSWATYKIENISVGASANNLAVFIWCEDETTTVTTDILRITDVQLEEGAFCTSVDRRPLAQEQDLAEYYFRRYGGLLNALVTPIGFVNGATSILANFQLVKRMFRTVVVTFSAANLFTTSSPVGPIVCTAISANSQTPFSFGLSLSVSTGLTTGQSGYAYVNSASGFIDVSSEL